MNPIERLARWSIDAPEVRQSDKTWPEIYRSQLRVPGLVAAMCVLGSMALFGPFPYLGLPPVWYVVGSAGIIAYSFLPALGAYFYACESGELDRPVGGER